ncbi:2OG-Fe dioxygenase family protein [Actinoplanes sp. NPDC049548]|uniref:2OG-Fe dioxygenase family protein n=1 Tax=Actinoplanes sp. NPDC049548 TaxID=3155152 RepID=UPI00343F7BEA
MLNTTDAYSVERAHRPIIDRHAERIRKTGHAVLSRPDFGLELPDDTVARFRGFWDDLPLDDQMADGGVYRERRFGRILATVRDGAIDTEVLEHSSFRQEADIIPFWGGKERTFAPAGPDILLHPVMRALVGFDVSVAAVLRPVRTWVVNVHLVRIVARAGAPGLPTPEGRHRDGHEFVAMHLLRRECEGGESIVHADPQPVRLTLREPFDSLMVDDARLTHEVTPIAGRGDGDGVRDMLLVDLNPAP